MGLKVCIIGMSPDSRKNIPWVDSEWEKWGLAWDGDWAGFDRVFEIHDPATFGDDCYPKNYRERLSHCPKLYLQRKMPEFPGSIEYPLADVVKTVGMDYFQSSVAYMIALAIYEGAEEIGIYGVEMNDDYGYQRKPK